jgi:hypothetical protein
LALQVLPEECEDERGNAKYLVPVDLVILNCEVEVGSRESNDAAVVEAAWRIV